MVLVEKLNIVELLEVALLKELKGKNHKNWDVTKNTVNGEVVIKLVLYFILSPVFLGKLISIDILNPIII